MAFPRRVLLTVASGSLLYSGMVSALGMGEITVHSALNQPLDAEIELLDVGSLSADQIRITLAPAEAFDAAGVERLAFLQDLRFAPLIQGDNSRIRVVSSNPVREPYLNFLVQISRANSRILREYTLLLDPAPVSSSYQSSASPAVVQAVVSRAIAAPAVLPAASKGATHQVQKGESLWLIARSLSTSGNAGSIASLMRDIQVLNPGAFIGGDPSRLKAGSTLLLPDSAAAVAAPTPEPVAEAPTPPAPAPAAEATEVAALRREMLDELAASREENLRLKEMLAQVQTQLESVQAQLEQTRLAPAAPAALPTGEAASPTNVASESQAAEPAATAAPAPSAAVQAAPPVAAAAPVQTADAILSGEWLRTWGVPGALVALLAGLGWARRRRANAEQSDNSAPDLMPAMASEVQAPVMAARPLSAKPQQSTPAVAAAVPVATVAAAPVAEPDVLQAADLYLTYGRRDEALGVLLRGIEAAPERTDLRLRALQLLAQTGDQHGYVDAAAGYLEAGGDPVELERLLATYPAMAAHVTQAAPAAESLKAVLPASAQSFEEFPVTLDELSLDADWSLIDSLDATFDTTAEPRQVRNEAVEQAEQAPLFELDLSALPEVEVIESASTAADDETLILGELPDLFDPFDEGVDASLAGAVEPQAAAGEQAELKDESVVEGEQPKPGKPRMSLVRSA